MEFEVTFYTHDAEIKYDCRRDQSSDTAVSGDAEIATEKGSATETGGVTLDWKRWIDVREREGSTRRVNGVQNQGPRWRFLCVRPSRRQGRDTATPTALVY